MNKRIEVLITEMQEVKTAYPTMEIPDVLRIFNIQALRDLTNQFRRVANNG